MGQDRFDLWFGTEVQWTVEGHTVTVTAKNPFAADRLRRRHVGDLQAAIRDVLGPAGRVRIDAAPPPPAATEPPAAATSAGGGGMNHQPQPVRASSRPLRRPDGPRRLQPSAGLGGRESAAGSSAARSEAKAPSRWTMSLNHFVVGPCNELAHTAIGMVVRNPASASPIYLCGPPGTGKTHLMTAVRDTLRRTHRLRRVIQLTAEAFTNDFQTALGGSGLPAFRRRYRDVDALLVDDVQFFSGNKRATLRELQHTVDALLRSGKQLIFAADRKPLEVEGLSSELAARMSSGMTCFLEPLDLKTREQVLQQFAMMNGLELPKPLVESMAQAAAGDGRLLSGLIQQVRALYQLHGKLPTWQQVLDSAAGDLLRASKPIIGLGDIQKIVCDVFELPAGTLQSRGQQRRVSQPRMLAMYLARQYTSAAYAEIGDFFGNRSHSTVIAAMKRVEQWLREPGAADAGNADSDRMRRAAATIQNQLRIG